LFVASPVLAGTVHAPIIGGTQAKVGDYPAVVAVEVAGGLCTGTLITPEWVLTAAHCVLPSELGVATQAQVTSGLRITINSVNVNGAGGTVLKASDSMPDPMFNINALGAHDSGLIKLATPVTDTKPTLLNFDPKAAPVGIGVTMVGFGATAQGGMGQVGVEMVVAQTSIACTLQEGTDANLLCFNQTNGKGKCNGDSGGPSFAMINGKQVQVGITSFGDQNCAQFGADTRVDAEKAFITAHVPGLSCDVDTDCPDMKECFSNRCIVTPFQATGIGATCTTGTDCDSGDCATGDGGSKCTMDCTVGTDTTCPSGFDCLDSGGGAGLCWPTGGGCCDASGRGAPTALLGIALVGLVWRRRRPR
jgi:hypothetical protein